MPEKIVSRPSKMSVPYIVQSLYMLSVLSAVLPFGAVHPIPLSFATVFSCLVAFVSALVFGVPAKTRWLFAIGLLLAVLTTAWVEIQSFPALSPGLANPLWGDLSRASIQPGDGAISIQPANSVMTLMFMAVPMMTFLTGLTVTRSDDDGRRIVLALAVGGAVCAVYGLIQFTFFPNTNLFFPKTAYLDSLTATFINRNTAGTFLGLVCLALIRYAWSLSQEISWATLVQPRISGRKTKSSTLSFFMFIALLLACSLAALFLTKSRGAIASTFVALLFLVCFLALQQTKKRLGFSTATSRGKIFLRAALAVVTVAVVLGTFGGRALLRVEAQGGEDGRYCVLPGILQLAKGESLLGYGFGTFRYAFPPYRDPQCGIVYIWERAHNFYLEGLIGLGAIFVPIAVTGISALLIAHVMGLRKRRRMRSYSALGFASILLVGLHGLVDFSLEIPGMATYFAALIAATSTISLGKSAEGESRSGVRDNRRSAPPPSEGTA